MPDMTQDPHQLDRRSLIKKGLVAGGVVATVPVISTFNAPAFAASPGTYRLHFRITLGALDIIVLSTRGDVAAACSQINAAWQAALPDPGPGELAASVGGTILPPQVVVSVTEPNCVITAARLSGNGNNCSNTIPSGIGTQTVSFPFIIGLVFDLYVIVTCT